MFNKLTLYCMVFFYIYVSIFTAYFFLIVFVNMLKKKRKKISSIECKCNNLAVIIYSRNNEKTVVNLLEQLNKQTYPKDNYQVHIILDNCSDNSSNKLEFVGGAKLWRFNEDIPLGKDRAISYLLENLLSSKQVDAYIFLDVNRIVKTDFLENINSALQKNDVIVGSTEFLVENANYYDKVLLNLNQYNDYVIKKGRSSLGLSLPIDSDITIIKHEVLEKVKFIDFKNANSELKYSFLLTKIGYMPVFVPDIKTYISTSDYKNSSAKFFFKLSLFFHCFNFRSFDNLKFIEFLFYLLKPNPIILIAIIIAITAYSFNNSFLDNMPGKFAFASILIITFLLSIYKANMFSLKKLIYLMSAPFYSLSDSLNEFAFIRKMFMHRNKKNVEKPVMEKISVPVNVTNGRNIFHCTLDLVSEGGFKKAVFRYKNKKQETVQSYVRMCDAVKNITNIIEQHGFRIQICQSCAYFSPKIDGTNNMIKGYCNKKASDNKTTVDIPEMLLWASCENFIPQEVNNVIDLLQFVKK